METHLSTLSATLSSIASLHASTVHSKPSYQPFTSAILNSYGLDVVDYIRDADALEAKLFWYPPVGGSGGETGGAPSTSTSSNNQGQDTKSRKPRGSDVDGAAGPSAASLQPRVPEPRQFVPPTPLRKGGEVNAPANTNSAALPASAAHGYDARTLLTAAQKLCENYHNAPRARKHVKALLKRSQELSAVQSRCLSQISELEQEVKRLSSLPAPASSKGASASGATSASSNVTTTGKAKAELENSEMAKRLKKVEEKKQREEMEIVALESMIEELEMRRKIVAKKAAQAKAAAAAAAAEAASADADDTVGQPSSDDTTVGAGTGGADESGLSEDGAQDATIRLVQSSTADPANSISASGDKSASRRRSSGPRVIYPEATDELERIAENIWSVFGDYLRWVAPEREGGDFLETIKIIESLEVGRNALSALGGGDGEGDASVSDAGTAITGTSTSSTSSIATTSSSGAGHASPPTILTLLSAHTLSTLLRCPAPHSKDLTSLKAEGERWWNEVGSKVWEKLGNSGAVSTAAGSGAETSGETMTNKAVYDLIAKKLFRVKHQAGLRVISFS